MIGDSQCSSCACVVGGCRCEKTSRSSTLELCLLTWLSVHINKSRCLTQLYLELKLIKRDFFSHKKKWVGCPRAQVLINKATKNFDWNKLAPVDNWDMILSHGSQLSRYGFRNTTLYIAVKRSVMMKNVCLWA